MDLSTVDFSFVVSIMSKPCKSRPVQIYVQRVVRCDQDVKSEVELLTTNQQRVRNISLTNVWLGIGLRPGLNGTDSVEQKDAFALGLGSWLHNPYIFIGAFLKLISKEAVLEGQMECQWEKVVLLGFRQFALFF